jgi:phytoene dehydrogenase-like protein
MPEFDAVVVGAGPNGLSAALRLTERGFSTCVVEAKSYPGGGLHSRELGEANYVHDECSAIHPMGILSPYFRTLNLQQYGLVWRHGRSSVAHPLLDRPAAILYRDFERTIERLAPGDGRTWRRIFEPLAASGEGLLSDLMGPFKLPKHWLAALRFGLLAHRSAANLVRGKFQDTAARALFAGLAGHSILPLEHRLTAAFGLIFGLTAHLVDWPCAEGGSARIAQALVAKLREGGGVLRLGELVSDLKQLPSSKVVLFDLSPRQLSAIAGDQLPTGYRRRLDRYVYGPGTFKLDFTLDGAIPWTDPEVRGASTVHVGGTHSEIEASERAAWIGDAPTAPYLIVCQQSELDASRAPAGKHTGYAYCHVPAGYPHDVSSLIEAQIERFAPGFRDLIRTRHVTSPRDFEQLNPNFVGGAVTGGAATLGQLFTRPVARWDPYTTPNSRLFLCSGSTPPGGGVHGMCGFYAAESAIKRLNRTSGGSFLLSM